MTDSPDTPTADRKGSVKLGRCQSEYVNHNGSLTRCTNGGAVEYESTTGSRLVLCHAHEWQVQTPSSIWVRRD